MEINVYVTQKGNLLLWPAFFKISKGFNKNGICLLCLCLWFHNQILKWGKTNKQTKNILLTYPT